MCSSNRTVRVQAFFHCTLAIVLCGWFELLEHKKNSADLKDSVLLQVSSNYLQSCCFCLRWSKQLPKVRTKQEKNGLSIINASTCSPCRQVSTTGCRKRNILSTNSDLLDRLMQLDFNCNSLDIPEDKFGPGAALRQTSCIKEHHITRLFTMPYPGTKLQEQCPLPRQLRRKWNNNSAMSH